MLEVSQAWLDNQRKTIVGESDVVINLGAIDPVTEGDIIIMPSGPEVYSAPDHTIVTSLGDDSLRYTTLEQNMWVLDQPPLTFTQGDPYTVYISEEISAGDRSFSPYITYKVNFTELRDPSYPGFTLVWDKVGGTFATDFSIRVYQADTIVAEAHVQNNLSVETFVPLQLQQYDAVEVIIREWILPYRKAVIEKIKLGGSERFDKRTIISLDWKTSAEPTTSRLPISELIFKVIDLDGKFDPTNPDGVMQYIRERNPVTLDVAYKGLGPDGEDEVYRMGTWFLSEWDIERSGKVARFVARDVLSFLEGDYNRPYFNYLNPPSAREVVQDILWDADLPPHLDVIGTLVLTGIPENKKIRRPLDNVSKLEALQLIANLTSSPMRVGREGEIRFESLEDVWATSSQEYVIDNFNQYSAPKITLLPVMQGIVSKYTTIEVDQESQAIGSVSGSNQGVVELYVKFDTPSILDSVSITGEFDYEEGKPLIRSYDLLGVRLRFIAYGDYSIEVWGTPIVETEYSIQVPLSNTGVFQTIENPLATTSSEAYDLAYDLERFIKSRQIVDLEWRSDPRLNVLDKVTVRGKYGDLTVVMTDIHYTYNGNFRARGRGRVIT
jgi:hypothetical protein